MKKYNKTVNFRMSNEDIQRLEKCQEKMQLALEIVENDEHVSKSEVIRTALKLLEKYQESHAWYPNIENMNEESWE